MKQTLVKIKTVDDIELVGILYTPDKSTKDVVVHVHGLAGNFYENSFVDYQAKTYADNGYAYFVFNNRGNGFFTDLIKKEKDNISYIQGGSSHELLTDSFFDIDAAIKFVLENGYLNIHLQGHSLGCNKVVNYYNRNNLINIKSIILLAPCDIIAELKKDLQDYDSYSKEAINKVNNNQGDSVIINSDYLPFSFTAKTFANDYLENSYADIFRYRIKNYTNDLLKKINVPVLVQIGSNDKASLTVDKKQVEEFLYNNLNNVDVQFIDDANHGYIGKESIMSINCVNYIKKY